MMVDGNPSRKTEIIRKTWTPSWNENFDVLVTANSRIEFKAYNHHSFTSDTLIGQCLIFLNKLSQETSNSNCINSNQFYIS